MAFDDSLRKDILAHCKITDVISSFLTITKKGKNYVAICPFHDDTTPSMYISPEKQMFKCFVCGTGGDAISFVSKYLHISYGEAMRKVAEIIGYHDPRLEKAISSRPVDEKKTALLKCLKDLTSFLVFNAMCISSSSGLLFSTSLSKRSN